MSIRILIVDDSRLTRNILSRIVEEAGMIVVATAPNGQEALARLAEHSVDMILLDMEMPIMNGLEFLSAMKRTPYTPPIIVVSALTERHAPITIESLLLGASDYICKPTSMSDGGLNSIKVQLLTKIQHIVQKRSIRTPPIKQHESKPPPPSTFMGNRTVIVIGVSTGGPKALETIISSLPSNFSHPILIVQHMPPIFTQMLAESLNLRTPLEVKEASGGESLSNGGIWIAPGDRHMSVRVDGSDIRIELTDGPKENFCRPAVDPLFRSVAQVCQQHALGFILTGMGQDGLLGSLAIKRRGGRIFVQDEQSSVVWGMPKAIVEAKQADEILPLEEIGPRLLSLLQYPTTAL